MANIGVGEQENPIHIAGWNLGWITRFEWEKQLEDQLVNNTLVVQRRIGSKDGWVWAAGRTTIYC